MYDTYLTTCCVVSPYSLIICSVPSPGLGTSVTVFRANIDEQGLLCILKITSTLNIGLGLETVAIRRI